MQMNRVIYTGHCDEFPLMVNICNVTIFVRILGLTLTDNKVFYRRQENDR